MTTATIDDLRAKLRPTPAEKVVDVGGLAFKLRDITAAQFFAIQEPYQTLAQLGKKATAEDKANAIRQNNLALVRSRVAEPDISVLTDDELLSMSPTLWSALVAACQQQADDMEDIVKNSDATDAVDSLTD
jgi:hypothetical protein